MKNNATKRALALVLSLALILSCMTGLMPITQADATEAATYGNATVYDIYDLTGSKSNTIYGTDVTWDGQIKANVKEEHKENIVFKTMLTMGQQEIRLSINALDGASIYDPSGYAVYINHNGGAPYISIKRNNSDLVVGSVVAVEGTWELEIGLVDILTDGVRTGKHLYVKKDGQLVCEVDDTNGYLTGAALGTKIVDFHYGAAIQMDTTYANSYGTAKVFDVYDVTGATSNTINGTGNGNWSVTEIGNIAAADKENASFKANVKITDNAKFRFSLAALAGADCVDPAGYGFELNTDAGQLVFVRGSSHTWIKSWSVDASVFKGEYVLEFGYRDITFGGNVIGKQVFMMKNGEVLYSYDDMDGYLTGDQLGTRVAMFHYGTAVQMNTTYESSYGTATVYDIYDLTGATSNTIKGTNDSWDGQIRANINAAHKENWAFKTQLTMGAQEVRLSLTAKDGDSHYDPVGYAVYLYGASNKIDIRRNNSSLKSVIVDNLVGTYTFEVGIVDILFGSNRVGKHIYVKMNDAVVCEYDDVNGYLTGDALGTKIIDFHYGASIQMDTTYTSGYGSANVYDIYDLTGTTAKSVDAWNPTVVGSFAAENKEQAALQMKMNITNQRHRYRFAVGNTADGNGWDPKGYGMEIAVAFDGQNHVKLLRNGSQIAKFDDISGLLGEHVYEFGYRNITMGDKVLGKQIYLSVDGVVLYSYDDCNGYLTGNSLGNTITLNHIDDSAVVLNSAYETSYGEAKTYDVADLTGAANNTINGTGNGNWSVTEIGNIDAADKENVSFKAKVKITDDAKYRFSLAALDGADCVDPAGYGFELVTGEGSRLTLVRGSSHTWIKTWEGDMSHLKGEYMLEYGYCDILFNGSVVGKRIFLMKNGEVLYSFDDVSGFLTGDQLGTRVAMFHYGSAVQMDSSIASFVKSYYLTLGSSTVMNIVLDPIVIADAKATVTVSVAGEATAYTLENLPMDASGMYVVSVPLAAAQMQDEVTVTLNAASGASLRKVYTITGYADVVMTEHGFTAEQRTAMQAMLHYGAAAQKYFGYKAENLADQGYTDSLNNVISGADMPVTNGKVSGVTYYGASLLMKESISLRHYLYINGDVNGYSFTFDGKPVTPVATTKTADANYYVQLDGILPTELDKAFKLVVTKGGETFTMEYSPVCYMQRMSANDNVKDLVQQLFDYYIAVKDMVGAKTVDTATVLDLYQISGNTSVTIPANQPYQLGQLVGADDSFVAKELTSNVAIRFKYTGGEGMRLQFGASTPDISSVSGALFMSVPDNNSFGIANIADNGAWCQDANGQDLFSWQPCLGRGQTSYIEIGCVKRYTDGVYTHDRYYVRAAASLEELDAMAANGEFSVFFDSTMKDNNGYFVIVRSRMDNGGDLLETTWTDSQLASFEASVRAVAQSATSSTYDALEQKYADTVVYTNTAATLAKAKTPTGSIAATGGDELILWAESGASKIAQNDGGKAASLASQKNSLMIQMAKNEDEGAQLMLFGNRNVEAYEIFATDLTNGSNVISADHIRLYQLKYLTVDDKAASNNTYNTPSAYAGKKLPDGMLPFAKAVEYGENSLIAGNNQAIYVDVSTGKTDAAGTYTGTIVVKTNTNQVYNLPITVVVQDVVLPDVSQLGTYAPYLGRDGFSSGELDGSDEMASLYVQTLQDFNMSSIIPASDDVMNIEEFLVNVRKNYNSISNYLLPIDFSDCYYTVNGKSTLVQCNYALLKEYVVALAKMSIADGVNYLDKAFFYPSDHADESKTEAEFNVAKQTYAAFCQMLDDADAALQAAYAGSSKYNAEIASSVKNLRFLLTVPGDDSQGKSLDIGALLTDFLKSANRKNVVLSTSNEVLVRDGYGDDVAAAMNGAYADELWTYLSLKPYYPYSNYAFDTPVVSLRTLGWTCYQENVDTLMTWKSVNYLYGSDGLSLDRWTTSSAGKNTITPGDGNVFYPGAKYGIDGPCPSLRAIAWRDGVDDYSLMSIVTEKGGSASNLNKLYGMVTETYKDSIKTSTETGSWWGSLISKNVNATVPITDDAKFIIVRNALLEMAASNASAHAAILSNAQSAVNGVATATGKVTALETAVSENGNVIKGNIYQDGYYQLADFETYEETIQNKFSGNAKLSLSSKAISGSYSLKVAVQPGQKGETVWIPTTSQYFSATTNFSRASKITFKVYNAQSTDSTVRFYLNTYDRSGDVYNAGTYLKDNADVWHDNHYQNKSVRYTLAPGWNEISINAADLGADYLSYVGAFIIDFESGAGSDATQVFYLDDVRVYMGKVN